jgi:hypothetical protein
VICSWGIGGFLAFGVALSGIGRTHAAQTKSAAIVPIHVVVPHHKQTRGVVQRAVWPVESPR